MNELILIMIIWIDLSFVLQEFMKIPPNLLHTYVWIAVACYVTARVGLLFVLPHVDIYTLKWMIGALLCDFLLVAFMISLFFKSSKRNAAFKLQMIQKNEELHTRNEQLELAWNGVGDGMWEWNVINNNVVYSDRFVELLGYHPHEIPHSYDEWKDRLHPSDKGYVLTALQAHIKDGTPFNVEYRLRIKSEEWQWFKARGQALWDSDGNPIRMAGSLTDISEHKFAEKLRDRLIKKLVTTNEQLEQFAYVASHDLHEPLRVITSFFYMVAKKYRDKLDEEDKTYISVSLQATKKMETIVADLLEYGRLGETSEYPTQIDCESVLHDALDNLIERIRSTQAIIKKDPLPVVMANAARFSRLFENLINNALRYQLADNLPIIHISAEDKGGYWQFAIADNGIGIKKEHLESVFIPFTRLQFDHADIGSGIELAICKRIVESFSGSIWVKSVKGSGSTFYFTVPKH